MFDPSNSQYRELDFNSDDGFGRYVGHDYSAPDPSDED